VCSFVGGNTVYMDESLFISAQVTVGNETERRRNCGATESFE